MPGAVTIQVPRRPRPRRDLTPAALRNSWEDEMYDQDGHTHDGTGLNSTEVHGMSDAEPATADGDYAFAGGDRARASAAYSIAIGYSAVVPDVGGDSQIAIGVSSEADAVGGVAIGSGALVVGAGDYGTAIGPSARVGNPYSTAIGVGAESSADNQIMLGTDTETVYLPGAFQMPTGAGAGLVLTSDGVGVGTWQSPSGVATIIVQEQDVTVDPATGTLDFQAGFDLTSAPAGEVNIALDLSEVATGGDLSWSGNTPTIPNDTIIYAKMQNVSAASKLLGRGDSGAGDVQEITLGSGLSMTGTTLSATGGGGTIIVQEQDVTVDATAGTLDFQAGFDVTSSPAGEANIALDLSEVATGGDLSWSGNVPTIPNDTVTFAKMQNSSGASKLLGRGSASGAGDFEEITLGSGLSMAGTVLSATGGGGSVATDVIWDAKGDLAVGTGSDTAARLAVGTDGYVLVAASGEATGLKWQVLSAGRYTYAHSAKTADYTLTGSDDTVTFTGTHTATLPTAVSIAGRRYTIKNAGTGIITVATTSSQTIDGSTTFILSPNWSLDVESDGANWNAI